MVAKKKAPPANWGAAAEKPAPDDTADNMHDGEIPSFLKDDGTAKAAADAPDPAQLELEAAMAETKPDNPKPIPVEEAAETFGELETKPDPDATLGTVENPSTPPEPEPEPAPTGGDGRELARDDNQPRTATVTDETGTVAGKQLFAFVERVERLEEEKSTINEDIREVFSEMKGTGFDVPTVRKLLKLRKMDPAQRQEAEALLDVYKSAIGMA